MPDDYGGMSISDWDSAKQTVQRHLAVLLEKNPNYRGIFDTLLVHLIVDIFMVKERPSNMSAEEFVKKYTGIFHDGLGINLSSLESDDA
jgi:hypothetical protein